MADLSVNQEDGVTIVALGPGLSNLDEATTQSVKDEILTATSNEADAVLVDLSEVRFFSSSFIEVLFRVWNRLEAKKGRFAICGLTEYCAEVLGITRLDRLWETYPGRDEALAALKQST